MAGRAMMESGVVTAVPSGQRLIFTHGHNEIIAELILDVSMYNLEAPESFARSSRPSSSFPPQSMQTLHNQNCSATGIIGGRIKSARIGKNYFFFHNNRFLCVYF